MTFEDSLLKIKQKEYEKETERLLAEKKFERESEFMLLTLKSMKDRIQKVIALHKALDEAKIRPMHNFFSNLSIDYQYGYLHIYSEYTKSREAFYTDGEECFTTFSICTGSTKHTDIKSIHNGVKAFLDLFPTYEKELYYYIEIL